MNSLPVEIVEEIVQHIPKRITGLRELTQVNKRLRNVLDTQQNWYNAFKTAYPTWSSHLGYNLRDCWSPDWKKISLDMFKKNKQLCTLKVKPLLLDSLPNHSQPQFCGLKRKNQSESDIPDEEEENNSDEFLEMKPAKTLDESFFLTIPVEEEDESGFETIEPIVNNVDPTTKKGIVGMVKIKYNVDADSYQSKIMLYEYPSWRLKHCFNTKILCQLSGIQTIRVPTANSKKPIKMTFFSVTVGVTVGLHFKKREMSSEELFIYRLHDNNDVQCVAHLTLGNHITSPEVFLFSEASWMRYVSDDDSSEYTESIASWLRVLSPEQAEEFEPEDTLFATIFGETAYTENFGTELFQFTLNEDINLDPLLQPETWDEDEDELDQIIESFSTTSLPQTCNRAYHFRSIPCLNHLLVANDSGCNALLLFDWRFGIKIGTLPRTDIGGTCQFFWNMCEDQKSNFTDKGISTIGEVIPWSYKITTAIPLDMSGKSPTKDRALNYGLRLVTVGRDNSLHQRFQSWDISYLLDVSYCPLADNSSEEEIIKHASNGETMDKMREMHPWWDTGPRQLQNLALKAQFGSEDTLPYSSPEGMQLMVTDHSFIMMDPHGWYAVRSFDMFKGSIVFLLDSNEFQKSNVLLFVDVETAEPIRQINLGDTEGFEEGELTIIDGNEIIANGSRILLHGKLA